MLEHLSGIAMDQVEVLLFLAQIHLWPVLLKIVLVLAVLVVLSRGWES